MREKLCVLILIILILPSDYVYGKVSKNLVKVKDHQNQNLKDKVLSRQKRSFHEEVLKNRIKRQNSRSPKNDQRYDHEKFGKVIKLENKINEPPFWGTRGRRDSSSDENFIETDFMSNTDKYCQYCKKLKHCKDCYGTIRNEKHDSENSEDDFDSEDRLGRSSFDDTVNDSPFWGNRGRRQEDDDPFWGTRGRRQEDEPFWGNRGRREKLYRKIYGQNNDIEPFWGNRGRREESEPFWGNRGRRLQDVESSDWRNKNKNSKQEILKDSIIEAINDVENNIEHLSRLRRSDEKELNKNSQSFWANRGRMSKLNHLFSQKQNTMNKGQNRKWVDPGTVLNDRMYAEEPSFILIERSSRSSGEDDPYFISRGKKRYFFKTDEEKAARDRRGSIEEIVKSVRSDPFYIARGKKDSDGSKIDDSSPGNDTLAKVKELICSSLGLISSTDNKVKRNPSEGNDRERRMILKKLAAQLQIDPYFVSRGKKSDDTSNSDYLEEFVNNIANKCNY